jgi:hypothetical protein
MVDQAQITPAGRSDSPPRAVARNTAEFVHDVVSLVELQTSLLKIDVQQCLAKMVVPGAVAAVGAVLVLSCMPILLASVALLMVELAGWTHAQAFFFALGCGLVIGGGACLWAAWRLRSSFNDLARSREEFSQNVAWVKQVLKRLGTASHSSNGRWNGH